MEKARQQRHQRALAAAGSTDQGHGFAGSHVQIDATKGVVLPAGIAQAYAVQTDFAAHAFRRIGARIRFCGLVENGEHRLGRRQATLNQRLRAGQPLQRGQDRQHRGHEGGEGTGGQTLEFPRPGGHVDHQRQAAGCQDLHQRRTHGIGGGHLQMLPPIVFIDLGEALGFVLLATVDLDLALAQDHVLPDLGDVGHRGLDAPADGAIALGHQPHHQGNGRAGQQHR